MELIDRLGQNAVRVKRSLAVASTEKKNAALECIAAALDRRRSEMTLPNEIEIKSIFSKKKFLILCLSI